MRITDLLSASSIDLNAKPLNKKEAIEQAVKLMAAPYLILFITIPFHNISYTHLLSNP